MLNNDSQNLWSILIENFKFILENNTYYKHILSFTQNSDNNLLLYGHYGFPIDLFIDELLKRKFDLDHLHKQHCVWGKDIHYLHNNNFLEIDLNNPDLSKKFSNISKFLTNVTTNKHIVKQKHYIIIKHIDSLSQNDFACFRIILEKYSKNATFICITHKLDKIDIPVRSRFSLIRMPLLQHSEIIHIFHTYFKKQLNEHLLKIKTRDIIKSIFLTEVQNKNSDIVSWGFCVLNYPPLQDFIKNLSLKKNNLEAIRKISYDIFQYNINLSQIVEDLLKLIPKKKFIILHYSSQIDHILCLTNNGREPIYIETFLCQVLL
jgi:DNA polymerase III delta prime subunit